MFHLSLHQVSIPMKVPFTHRVTQRSQAEALILTLESQGFVGAGESVPRPYVTGETYDSVWEAIQSLNFDNIINAIDLTDLKTVVRSIEGLDIARQMKGEILPLSASGAVELALLDWSTKILNKDLNDVIHTLPLPQGLVSQEPLTERLSVALDFQKQPEDLIETVNRNARHLKVKVGNDFQADRDRLLRCRDLFGSELSISVDANMAWSLDQALHAAELFRPFQLAWFEEPLQPLEWHRYSEFRQRSQVPVMLDESACGRAQIEQAIGNKQCDLINIRLSKCGGFLQSLRIVEMCYLHNVGYQLGSMVGQLGILNAANRQFSKSIRNIRLCEGGLSLANLSESIIQECLQWSTSCSSLTGLSEGGHGANINWEQLRKFSTRSAKFLRGKWLNA